ncbi:type II toxin-antitoxin system HicB family antitoxin [Candidatus Roizmanbacteria bacterium]|nr:type II toxin-antitoxin system HicB family antitoxin [Candidatus Roizmanbacteria bacterium]
MRNIDKYKNVLSYSVIYQEDPEGGYVVNVPALPGCHTQGDTIDEVEQNIKEAILLYLENLKLKNHS